MLGPAFAVGSSLGYGVSDFLGGTTSRRIGTLAFIFCMQIIMIVVAASWVALSADPVPPVATLAAATGAGLSMTIGLATFFRAMVVGKMSLVAPITATGVVVPVVAGIVRGERPTVVQAVGIVAVTAGVVVAARLTGERRAASIESGLGLALLAALGTGLFLWLMAPASRHGIPWALLTSRAIPAVALTATVIIRRTSLGPALVPRTASRILASSLLAFSATALYGFATLHGQLVIVSVLGSLYPVVTVLLAHRLLGERVHGAQRFGIAAVLAGVVLLSA